MFLKKIIKFHNKTLVLEYRFNKLSGLHLYQKKKLQHRSFPVNSAKFFITAFFRERLSRGWYYFLFKLSLFFKNFVHVTDVVLIILHLCEASCLDRP